MYKKLATIGIMSFMDTVDMDDVYSPKADFPESKTAEEKGAINKVGGGFVDFIQTLVVFGAIFAMIYLFVAQPHKVSGLSMFPTYHNNDYIMTDKLTYHFRKPSHGEVIVLRNPRDHSVDFIKRIIAIPGDSLKVEGGHVFVNGQQLAETYLPPGLTTGPNAFLQDGETITVGPSQYFVFGDNRNHSSDSREWGPVASDEIIGKVFFRYWPLNALGIIKN